SWARYSSRTVCASVFTRSASSRLPRIRSVRACIVLWTAGKANLAMSTNSTMNERKPQMISFLAGRMGLGAFPKASTARRAMAASMAGLLGELEQDEHDEADEGQGFGEGDAEEHGGAHHARGFRLAGHGRDGVAHDDADADAGADGRGAVADAGAHGAEALQQLVRLVAGGGQDVDHAVVPPSVRGA